MDYKNLCSAVAIALTFTAFIPYMRDIVRGHIKPHVFSWVIWGATTSVVFFAQLEGKGGAGAWAIGLSGAISILIALLAALKHADSSITQTDWLFFAAALSSLPFWYLTRDPLWAVVVLTTVDLLGFGPTIRKAYDDPHSESQLFFALFLVRNFFVLMALATYSVTTVLFPAAIAITCALLIVMVAYRRRALVKLKPRKRVRRCKKKRNRGKRRR